MATLAGFSHAFARFANEQVGALSGVIVVENGPDEPNFPPEVTEDLGVSVLRVANDGFAAANNVGLRAARDERILFLNPDTELVGGSLAAFCPVLDTMPDAGLIAVKQVAADGTLWATIRRFPTPGRTLAQTLGSERWPLLAGWVGERVLDILEHERVRDCDWTTGAVLLVRRAALEAAGPFDDRFFHYSEETDLCKRIRLEGWRVVHVPSVVFVHHAGKAGVDPRREAQMAHARMQYAHKHYGQWPREAFRAALLLGHALRWAALRRGATTTSSSAASRASIRVLPAMDAPPLGRRLDYRPARAPRGVRLDPPLPAGLGRASRPRSGPGPASRSLRPLVPVEATSAPRCAGPRRSRALGSVGTPEGSCVPVSSGPWHVERES